jgi:RNA-directed DNA polymerase
MALVERMSASMNLPPLYLISWGAKASHAYKTYAVPKRNTGFREIHHPAKELKALQRWLVRNTIAGWPVHAAAMGYRRGIGIKDMAREHAANRFLLRMDLQEFFPSIRSIDVDRYLEQRPVGTDDWTDVDRRLFVSLVCRESRLTIGAPSSPGLSNAMCFGLDTVLTGAAGRRDALYTRYADDLYFSTSYPNVLESLELEVSEIVSTCDLPGYLQVNRTKTRHLSKKRRRTVTGLVISSTGQVTIGRKRKRYIRAQIHRFGTLEAHQQRSLAGLLAFARDIEPEFINALILKYGHQRVAAAMQPRS